MKSYEDCLIWLDSPDSNKTRPTFSVESRVLLNKNFRRLTILLKDTDPEIFSKRIERDQLDIYTNDVDFYNIVIAEFHHIINCCYAPSTDLVDILEKNVILSSKKAYDKYSYKAYLLPHRANKDDKKQYLNWLDTQGDRIKISDTVKNWFVKTNYNWDRRYMYIEDEKTLLMVKMRNPDVLGRVYEYHVIDK